MYYKGGPNKVELDNSISDNNHLKYFFKILF